MNRCLLLLLSFFGLISLCHCSRESDSGTFSFRRVREYFKKDLVYDPESLILGSSSRLIYLDSVLIASSRKEDYFLTFMDLRTHQISNFGKKGQGPGELAFPGNLALYAADSKCFEVSDLARKKILVYHIDSCRKQMENVLPIRELEMQNNAYGSISLSDSTVLNTGFFSEQYAFLITNTREDTLSMFGDYNFNPADNHDPVNKALAYQGPFSRTLSGYIQACRNAPIVQLYSIRNSSALTLEKIVSRGFAEYESMNRNGGYSIIMRKDVPMAYCDVCATSKRIYLLYSGKSEDQVVDSFLEIFQCSEIHVMDWKGNFLEKMILDTEVVNIAVAEEEGIIYAITHNPDPQIIYFPL